MTSLNLTNKKLAKLKSEKKIKRAGTAVLKIIVMPTGAFEGTKR